MTTLEDLRARARRTVERDNTQDASSDKFSPAEAHFIKSCCRSEKFISDELDKARYIIRNGKPNEAWQIPLLKLGCFAWESGDRASSATEEEWVQFAQNEAIQYQIKRYYKSLTGGKGVGFYTTEDRSTGQPRTFMKIYLNPRTDVYAF
jgi:hypothetical protein